MSKQTQWPKFSEIDWPIASFLFLVPIVGLIGTAISVYVEGFSWSMLVFSMVFALLTNLSITAGYHRLFSHRSYDAHPLVRWILIFISTSAWQSSILKWCTDHRVHHSEVDMDGDPYSINKGFWYAHIGWMLYKPAPDFRIGCKDLQQDPLIRFQHKYYYSLATLIGFILPTAVGFLLGHPLTGFFMAGALRIGLTQQSTFFVNSLCHTLGRQTYSNEISARDSLIVAFLTHGEGYHNFHHKFQIDYRNGVRWWQWDPTKWTIQLLNWLGLAHKLRTVSSTEILKARLQMESLRLKSKGYSQEKLEQMKEKVIAAQIRWRTMVDDYQRLKKQWSDQSHERLEELKAEIELTKLEFQFTLKHWQTLLNSPVVLASI